MASRLIQEQFGQRIIEAFAEFARQDLDDVGALQANSFAHVTDVDLRRELAQVFYGARWIYKLGLALLTKDEERAAHVRAQIVDYAAVCEGLLSYCVSHAIRRRHTVGTAYQWQDPDFRRRPINWTPVNADRLLARSPMWWLIRISLEFGVISANLEKELTWVREQRNTVHLRARAALGRTAFLNQSKRAFEATTRAIDQTRTWRTTHQ